MVPYHPLIDQVKDEGSMLVAKRLWVASEDEYSFLADSSAIANANPI